MHGETKVNKIHICELQTHLLSYFSYILRPSRPYSGIHF